MTTPAERIQTLSTDLLLAIAKGELSAIDLAKDALISRGLNASGKWIGHDRARAFWTGRHYVTNAKGERVAVTIPTKEEEEG
ncbi:MAG TPA: hypothetical protein VL563_01115 [Gemmatimonadales bacterium]|jgi:hypothetical protein|nr:hypothetical protein [Gemmatimonadales bacterium]